MYCMALWRSRDRMDFQGWFQFIITRLDYVLLAFWSHLAVWPFPTFIPWKKSHPASFWCGRIQTVRECWARPRRFVGFAFSLKTETETTLVLRTENASSTLMGQSDCKGHISWSQKWKSNLISAVLAENLIKRQYRLVPEGRYSKRLIRVKSRLRTRLNQVASSTWIPVIQTM